MQKHVTYSSLKQRIGDFDLATTPAASMHSERTQQLLTYMNGTITPYNSRIPLRIRPEEKETSQRQFQVLRIRPRELVADQTPNMWVHLLRCRQLVCAHSRNSSSGCSMYMRHIRRALFGIHASSCRLPLLAVEEHRRRNSFRLLSGILDAEETAYS